MKIFSRNTKNYSKHGRKITKKHKVCHYKQRPWRARLKSYNAEQKTKAKTKFKKFLQIIEQSFLWKTKGRCKKTFET